jgi:predicted ATPase/class 3 adenylate cyclase
MKAELDRRLVAVMFTDMVGYTALIQADERAAIAKRDAYWRVVEHEHAVFGGTIVQRLGDGSMSMFPSAMAAVQAAIEAQRELAGRGVPVRIGIHVGEVIVEPEGLVGEAVNMASRIESFAVPGGVMVSDAGRDQLRNRTDVSFVSLGRFKLKNVGRAVELFAVSADGLVVPDRQVLEGKGERFASLPSNLPESATPLLGRAGDVDALVRLLRDRRVVTVTGPGGVGKTRLIVEAGRALAPEFLDAVAFVPLADVTAPENLVPAIAAALDVKEAEERTLGDGVVELIGDRKALLLLDNLEQVAAAAPEIARLVEGCPGLRVLTSSRTPLRIAAEREYPLAPLPLPSPGDDETAASLLDNPAIALFVDRARTAQGSFELTPANAAAVASVCRRLDGLPLAIELAAARLRILSPDALLERLDHALNLLTTGPRDLPERQQTLRGAIDWSHALLTGSEQRLFRRMAVFVGGCTFVDVEGVCAEPGDSALDDLESLVDKALIQVDAQHDRFRMLQTIAEYAAERLGASGEATEMARRHASRYAALARQIRDGIEGADQVGSLERGVVDESNVQAALDTLLAAAREGDASACEAGLQLCGDLYMYWHIRGKNLTARDYALSFLAADIGGSPTVGRTGALATSGLAWWVLGQNERANDTWLEAHRIATAIQAERERCVTAMLLGLGMIGFDLEAGLRFTAESIERSRRIGFEWVEGFAASVQGILQSVAGDMDAARASYSHGLDIQRALGDWEGAGLSLGGLAGLAAGRGNHAEAVNLYEQSLAAFQTIGDRAEEARVLADMAWTHLQAEDSVRGRDSFLESVQAYTDVASVRGVGLSLVGLAAAEAVENRPERAAQLAAAAEVYAQQEGIVNVYSNENPGREFVDRARALLSEEQLANATEVGRRLTIKQALDYTRSA